MLRILPMPDVTCKYCGAVFATKYSFTGMPILMATAMLPLPREVTCPNCGKKGFALSRYLAIDRMIQGPTPQPISIAPIKVPPIYYISPLPPIPTPTPVAPEPIAVSIAPPEEAPKPELLKSILPIAGLMVGMMVIKKEK